MEKFGEIFSNAMELICLGLYEKVQDKSEQGKYKYSALLKKALDKFSLLNITYSLFDSEGELLLPTDEAVLINTFNFPTKDLIDKLPKEYINELKDTEWYSEENYIVVGNDNCYYCMPDLLDKLNNERIFGKASKSHYKELELESQKFIELLFERNQEEYCEIRIFLEQKSHAFLTQTMFVERENIRKFKDKYPEIFKSAYEKLSYNKGILKICPYCGLILKEMNDGTLYCVSERCSKKSKGFSKYKEEKINGDEVWVLGLNVSRYIYYPGILEQNIKKVLEKKKISSILWPDKDTWDFQFDFNGERWVVDAKDVKSPVPIKNDILIKQKESIPYDKVIYVVPSDKKKNYLEAIRGAIEDRAKIQCITFADFKKIINER